MYNVCCLESRRQSSYRDSFLPVQPCLAFPFQNLAVHWAVPTTSDYFPKPVTIKLGPFPESHSHTTSGFIYSLFCLEQSYLKVYLAGIFGHHPLVDVFSVFPRLYSWRDLVLRAEALKALMKVFSHGKGTLPKTELNPGTWDFNYMLFKLQTGCFSLPIVVLLVVVAVSCLCREE